MAGRYVLYQVTETGYRYSSQEPHVVEVREQDLGVLFAIAKHVLKASESVPELLQTERFRAYLQHVARFSLRTSSGVYLLPTHSPSVLPATTYPDPLPFSLLNSIWAISSQQRLDENSTPVVFGTVFPEAKFALLNFLDSGNLRGLSDALYLEGLRGTEEVWSVYFPAQGELPLEVAYQGVVLSGGEYSVYDTTRTWTCAAEEWIRRAVNEGKTKLLGLCYGCQLIAQALGGRVTPNPSGQFLCHPDLVSFQGFLASLLPDSPQLYLSECHGDCVVSLPAVGELQGQSSSTQVEAWGIASRVLCTQGHPEFSSAYMQLCYLPSLYSGGFLTSAQLEAVLAHYQVTPPSPILLSTLRHWLHSLSS